MKKEYYLYIIGFLLLIAGVIYYNRPLPSVGLIDPGESYFTLPERTLPSSWDMVNKEYAFDNLTSKQNKQLNNIDTIITEDIHRKNYYYSEINTGNKITNMNRDSIERLFFTGNNSENIQYHIDNLGEFMSGYEIYPPRLDFITTIPRFQPQGIFRVGSIYSALLCQQGKIIQCTENFKILFNFSQQTKNSNSLIGLLIGVVEENIVINHIEYLYQSDSVKYGPLITMLEQQDYMKAKNALRYAFMSEYHLFKNAVDTSTSYDINSLLGNELGIPGYAFYVFENLSIPTTLFLDTQETKSIGRAIYRNIVLNAILDNPKNQDFEAIDYRSKGSPWLRKNIIGYHIIKDIIPRLTGIHQRTIDTEQRFYNLINQ